MCLFVWGKKSVRTKPIYKDKVLQYEIFLNMRFLVLILSKIAYGVTGMYIQY